MIKVLRCVCGALLAAASLCLAAAALQIVRAAPGRETVLLTELANPALTVSAFMDALCAQEYETAYTYLTGYATLGLENTPENDVGARFWALVREHTTWAPAGDCGRSGMAARQDVTITGPDVTKMVEGLDADVNALLAERTEAARLRSEIYNEDGSFRQEVVLAAYNEALGARLSAGEIPMRTETVTICLEYRDPVWKIVPDGMLTAALTGGVA